MFIVSLFVVAAGLALVFNAVTSPLFFLPDLPRPGAPNAKVSRELRMLPIAVGVFFILSGGSMLLVLFTRGPDATG